jgi:hypothetical protein
MRVPIPRKGCSPSWKAGLLGSYASRRTGSTIAIVDTKKARFRDAHGPWATICEKHGYATEHRHLFLAVEAADKCYEWCAGCKKVVAKKGA